MSPARRSASRSVGATTTVTPERLRATAAIASALAAGNSPAVIGASRSMADAAAARARIERSVRDGAPLLMSLGFRDKAGCRETLRELDAHHSAATSLDDVTPDDVVGSPVRALHQHVGLNLRDDRQRRVLVEHNGGVHTLERQQDFDALLGAGDGSPRSLVRRDGPIRVHRDDESITEGAGVRQIANVARMKEIEHTVR